MNCPNCHKSTSVVDVRMSKGGLRRRRKCLYCDQRFSTLETVVSYTKAGGTVWRMIRLPVPAKPEPRKGKENASTGLLERLVAAGKL